MKLLACGVASLAVALMLMPGSTASPAYAATVDVAATESGSANVFAPATIDITVGDTVEWEFVGVNPHTVTSTGAESFDSGLPPQTTGTFTHTFSTAGSFSYRCVLHSEMTGTVNVSAAATATPIPPTSTPAGPTNTPHPTNTPDGTETSTPEPGTPTATATPGTPTATVEGIVYTPIPAASGDDIAPSPTTPPGAAAGATRLPSTGGGHEGGANPTSVLMAALVAVGMATLAAAGFRMSRDRAD